MPRSKSKNVLENSKPGCIHVGRALVSRKVFVGFPPKMYDRANMPFAKELQHILEMDEDTARWLIGALRKELADPYDPDAAVEDFMDEENG